MLSSKPPFEQIVADIQTQIDRRQGSWRLSSVAWDDVRQIILIRVFLKYHTFNPKKGEFSHWLSRLITRAMANILRDNYVKWSRPCIKKCPFNTGGDGCSKTSTGKQGNECLAYKIWEKNQQQQHNVKQTLPLENHMKEAENYQSDFLDIAGAKNVIDRKMREKLSKYDYKIYKSLYIQHKSEKEVGESLGLKKVGKMHAGYIQVLSVKKIIVKIAKEIIGEENLV